MSASPTLSGAELGKCNPRREVPGGIWIEEGGALVNRPAWDDVDDDDLRYLAGLRNAIKSKEFTIEDALRKADAG